MVNSNDAHFGCMHIDVVHLNLFLKEKCNRFGDLLIMMENFLNDQLFEFYFSKDLIRAHSAPNIS